VEWARRCIHAAHAGRVAASRPSRCQQLRLEPIHTPLPK
jgi:hypothetical protein